MAVQRISNPSPGTSDIQQKINVADGVTSDWYLIPSGVDILSVDLIPAGTAKIQTSNDVEGVIAGTATAIDWDLGNVTTNIAAESGPVRAIRLVSISGEASCYLVGVLA